MRFHPCLNDFCKFVFQRGTFKYWSLFLCLWAHFCPFKEFMCSSALFGYSSAAASHCSAAFLQLTSKKPWLSNTFTLKGGSRFRASNMQDAFIFNSLSLNCAFRLDILLKNPWFLPSNTTHSSEIWAEQTLVLKADPGLWSRDGPCCRTTGAAPVWDGRSSSQSWGKVTSL